MKEIIRKIEESDKLDFETKLLALCEIDDIMKGKYPECNYYGKTNSLMDSFFWSKTSLGVSFWGNIHDEIEYK